MRGLADHSQWRHLEKVPAGPAQWDAKTPQSRSIEAVVPVSLLPLNHPVRVARILDHQRYSIFHAWIGAHVSRASRNATNRVGNSSSLYRPCAADDGSADAHPWSGGGGVAGTCGWSAIVPSLDHIQGLTIKLQDSAINITRI
jgi:hypothetical protein